MMEQVNTSTTSNSDSGDAPDAPTQLSDLPPALLTHILQRVPQQQRLCSAALVASTWAKAAAQATVSVQHTLKPDTPVFEHWLEQHATQLESIEITGPEEYEHDSWLPLLQLPWARLSGLKTLNITRVKLAPVTSTAASSGDAQHSSSSGGGRGGGSSAGAAQLLPRLKQLTVRHATFASTGCLLQLASNSQLTSLEVLYGEFGVGRQHFEAGMSTLLQRLPHLRLLGWQVPRNNKAALQHVCAMQHLQELELCADLTEEQTVASSWFSLPVSLTRLDLSSAYLPGTDDGKQVTVSSYPVVNIQLTHLSRLLQLRLNECTVQPAVLAMLPQLQQLELVWCDLLPMSGCVGQPAASAAFLSAVQRMTQLECLTSDFMRFDVDGVPPQQFSALTASPHLHTLQLKTIGHLLPQAALSHAFPAHKKLPQLQQLYITLEGACTGLAHILSCCPALEQLCVYGLEPESESDLSVLLQLPTPCRDLSVGLSMGNSFVDASIQYITQLTELTHLHIGNALSLGGLLQLTSLRGLKSLSAIYAGQDSALWWQSIPQEGPVWQQLEALCAKIEKDCAV